jgi:hypothetical protein
MVFFRQAILVALCCFAAAGCSDKPPIKSYTVKKPEPLEAMANPHDAGLPKTLPGEEAPPSGPPTDRTLAVIVPTTPQGWFFKLTGPEAAVAALETKFNDFLSTVKFENGEPTWKLPDGWQQQPGNAFRFATIVIPGEAKPLELTVSGLPNSGDDNVNYVLANVNRWRGQLQLPKIDADALGIETQTIEVDGTTATRVNLAGHAAAGGMQPPFMSGAPNGN